MSYSMTIQKMIDYIQAVCQKKGWSINQESIVEMLNNANLELSVDSEFILSYWSQETVADQENYELASDIGRVQDVYIVKTGEDGGKPLKRISFKSIKSSLHDSSLEDTIEP